MARHWSTRCRHCNADLGYSDALARRDAAVGRPPACACSACERLLTRELRAVAMPETRLPRSSPGTAPAAASPLGSLPTPAHAHTLIDQPAGVDPNKFGVRAAEIERLYEALTNPEVRAVIAVAPTGSGKSTYMPYRLLEPLALEWLPPDTFTRFGQIVVTQPRIAPTREIPGYVSGVMHGMPPGRGYDIGYRYSGNPLCDWRCRMVYVTDGTLINWLANGDADKMGLVMIDEAHERSLNIDIIIGLLVRLLPRHPHLKVLIASATIDADKFRRYFTGALPGGRAEVVEMSGKSYGVTPHFSTGAPLKYTRELDRTFEREMPGRVADEVVRVLNLMQARTPVRCDSAKKDVPIPEGDVVAFLHGAAAIDEAVELIRERLKAHPELAAKTDVYPLYRDVDRATQDAALKEKKDKSRRRIIVSSNMAETSLTIEGVVHVVESGIIKVNRWDPVLEKSALRAMTHSRGGCRQRWGRAGRLCAGHAWCLYTSEQFENPDLFPRETPPDILKSPLDQVTLDAKRAGADGLTGGAFPWLDEPAPAEFEAAARRLRRQGALDADGDLTAAGFDLRNGGGDTTTAKVLATADRFGLAIEAATVLAILNTGWRDLLPFERDWPAPVRDRVRTVRQRLRFGCRDDLEFALKLYQQWSDACSERGPFRPSAGAGWARRATVDDGAMRAAHAERERLIEVVGAKKKEVERRDLHYGALDRLRAVFAWCLPDHVYVPNELPLAEEVAGDDAPAGGAEDDDRYYGLMFEDRTRPPLRTLLDRDSVLAGRAVEAFVGCGPKNEKPDRRDPTPKARTVLVPFAVEVAPEMARAVQGLSELALGVYLSKHAPRLERADTGAHVRARLFMDTDYPLGSRVRYRVAERRADGTFAVEVLTRGAAAPPPPTGLPNVGARRPDPDRLDRQDREYSPWADGPASDAPRGFDASALEAERPSFSAFDESDEADAPRLSGRPVPPAMRFPGRLLVHGGGPAPAAGTEGNAEVVGHSLSGHVPAVLLAAPDRATRFEAFAKAHTVGGAVELVVANELGLPLPAGAALLVREPASGLDIALRAGDLGLQHPDVLAGALAPNTTLRARVAAIDPAPLSAEVTLLPAWDRAVARLAAEPAREYDAVVRHVHGTNCWLHLAVDAGGGVVPARLHGDFTGGGAGVPYAPGQRLKVALEFRPRVWEPAEGLSRQAVALARSLSAHGLLWTDGEFAFAGRMTYDQRQTLLALARGEPGVCDAIATLYLWSNTPTARPIVSDLDKKFPVGSTVRGKVARVLYGDGGAILALPGGVRGQIPPGELDWLDPRPRTADLLTPGQEIGAVVLSADAAAQVVRLSVKNARPNPWPGLAKKYPRGSVVGATVVAVRDDGSVVVELEPGLRCYVSAAYVGATPREGQTVRAGVHEVDPAERRIKLNLDRPREDPWVRLIPATYRVGTAHTATVVSIESYGAFVELEPGVQGLVHISELSTRYVTNVSDEVSVGERLRVVVIKLDTAGRKIGLSAKR